MGATPRCPDSGGALAWQGCGDPFYLILDFVAMLCAPLPPCGPRPPRRRRAGEPERVSCRSNTVCRNPPLLLRARAHARRSLIPDMFFWKDLMSEISGTTTAESLVRRSPFYLALRQRWKLAGCRPHGSQPRRTI